MSEKPSVVVVGAGVIGLSTAIRAQEAGYEVTIVAELFPGDEKSIRYTSAWAGAHHCSVATPDDPRQHQMDKETFEVMMSDLQRDPTVPLMLRPQIEYREEPKVHGVDAQMDLLGTFMPDFQYIAHKDLPHGVTHGSAFSTLMIDTPNYLPYLLTRFTSAGGLTHRTTLANLGSLLALPLPCSSTPVAIIHCSGIGAFDLVGDGLVFPTRGQTVLVRAPWVKAGITRTGKNGSGIYTYIIPRKSGDVIIGGTADVGDWERTPRPETTQMIKERGIALCPELLPEDKRAAGRIEDLDVIEEGCGLRPTRKGGIRLEIEWIEIEGTKKQIPVVHNYGHGGYGFQSSWGSARRAVELLKEALA